VLVLNSATFMLCRNAWGNILLFFIVFWFMLMLFFCFYCNR